jgi:hypothetical protein
MVLVSVARGSSWRLARCPQLRHEALVAMSESTGKGWWSAYRKVSARSALDLVELESCATTMLSYETLVVPGLLQTEEYMRVLFETGRPDASPEEIDRLVHFRLERQAVLHGKLQPNFHAVIHEAALRIRVGSPKVMREQLTHLIRVSRDPGVTIQILPFEAGTPTWFDTPFLILDNGVSGLETVRVEHPASPLNLCDEESISRYAATFDGLCGSALPTLNADGSPERHEQRDSWGLIQHILYTL